MKRYIKYGQKVLAILIVSGLLLFPGRASAYTAGSIVYTQAQSHSGGAFSDGPTLIVADEFQFNQSTLIGNITWWGGYASPHLGTPSMDNFTILLYADNWGQPGTLIQSFHIGNNAARMVTGDWVNPPDPKQDFEGREEFQYSFDLPLPFFAVANTRYWLGIINVPSSDSWVWESSANSLYPGIQRSFSSGPWQPYEPDRTFQFRTIEPLAPVTVNIDVMPYNSVNPINIEKIGTISVAILSSPTFDAPNQVLKSSLTFGRTELEQSWACCTTSAVDVNGDGLLDWVGHFNIQDAGFQLGDTAGILTGRLRGTNIHFWGVDRVSPYVPPE